MEGSSSQESCDTCEPKQTGCGSKRDSASKGEILKLD